MQGGPRCTKCTARGTFRDRPGTPARRSPARRPPCRGRSHAEGLSLEPARPPLNTHSFPPSQAARNRELFRPTSAPVGHTSCIFLIRHRYAPRRRPMAEAPGSCACSFHSIRALDPTDAGRRARRGGAGSRAPGGAGLVGSSGGRGPGRRGTGRGGRQGLARSSLRPQPAVGGHRDVPCRSLRRRVSNRSPGAVARPFVVTVSALPRAETEALPKPT